MLIIKIDIRNNFSVLKNSKAVKEIQLIDSTNINIENLDKLVEIEHQNFVKLIEYFITSKLGKLYLVYNFVLVI